MNPNNQQYQQRLNENLAIQIGQLTMQLAQFQTSVELLEQENKSLKDKIEEYENKK